MVWQFFGASRNQPDDPTRPTTQQVTLNFWGVYDSPAIYEPFISAYQALHPNIKINYTQQNASLYELNSVNNLAELDNGPDIWVVPLEWLPKHLDKFSSVPEGLLAKQNPQPTQPRRLFQRPSPTPTNTDLFKQLYAPLTTTNNIVKGKVATLPLAIDTLGLYVNPALIPNSDSQTLPLTWEGVVELTKKITKRTTTAIQQPAIALGTSNNVTRATDILIALMMQNQTPLIDEANQEALFNQTINKATGEPIQPGSLALDFYTSFASPSKESFTWTPSAPNDFELFSNGGLPMMIDYSYRTQDLHQKSPTLPVVTFGLPQIANTEAPATLGTALMVGVPTISKYKGTAWDFISFLTNAENSRKYVRASGRLPARLDGVTDPGINHQLLDPFIAQIPFAKTWNRTDISKMEQLLKSAIDTVLAGVPLNEVIDKLTKQATHLIRGEPIE